MTTFVDIRTALIAPIPANSSFGISFNYENKSLIPEIDTPHGRAYWLSDNSDQLGLGVNGCDEHIGVFQISLFYPEDDGDLPLLIKADEIAAVYKSGANFVNNSVTVTIDSINRTPAVNQGGWYQADLTINYFSFIRRQKWQQQQAQMSERHG